MTECSVSPTEKNHLSALLHTAAMNNRLMTVHWELTYKCNTRCTHCYAVKPGDRGFEAPSPELSTRECFDVIDQLHEEGALQIVFSGGEVLVRPDFFEIARYARSKQFLLRILTNGTLVTETVADKIAGLRPMSVEISVYGAEAGAHDGITLKPGSFRKVVRAFRLLRERNVRTVMKVPVMGENFRQVPAMRRLAQEVGAGGFRTDSIIVSKTNGDTMPGQHRLADDELMDFLRAELTPDHEPKVVGADDKHCFSGMHTMAINPYGEVAPCIQTQQHSAGDLRREPLHEIWRSATSLEQMRSIDVSSFPICSTCELKGVCGRCPGATEIEYGEMLAPNPEACRQSYARYQVLQENGVFPQGKAPTPASWKQRPVVMLEAV